MSGVIVIDNVLPDPEWYRDEVLKLTFRTIDFGHVIFHGLAVGPISRGLTEWLREEFPLFESKVTFFRRSPLGQVEPHLIHTDIDMGEWSAILYLNPVPPLGDGTSFWTHRATGQIESVIPHERSEEGKDVTNWELRQHVQAAFNRAVIFPSSYFHSRAIPENHGTGENARLTQITFGVYNRNA